MRLMWQRGRQDQCAQKRLSNGRQEEKRDREEGRRRTGGRGGIERFQIQIVLCRYLKKKRNDESMHGGFDLRVDEIVWLLRDRECTAGGGG